MDNLVTDISACRLCAERFGATATAHGPRPVVWVRPGVRVLIAGQAPGARVHASGRPFDDPSGKRLRNWMGVGEAEFYDRDRVGVLPMAFCFPGYDAKGSDLPPPAICAKTWHGRVMQALGQVPLTILVGGYAMRYHLNWKGRVDEAVAGWRDHAPSIFLLPHPSWRNTAWLKKNPFFEQDVVPALRSAVKEALT